MDVRFNCVVKIIPWNGLELAPCRVPEEAQIVVDPSVIRVQNNSHRCRPSHLIDIKILFEEFPVAVFGNLGPSIDITWL